MANFSDIILNGKKAGKTLEEINKELKAAGANFSLKSMDEEGFKRGDEPLMVDGKLAIMASDGKPIVLEGGANASVKTPTMARDISRAGKVITAGNWKLFYDENGYCKKKVRI